MTSVDASDPSMASQHDPGRAAAGPIRADRDGPLQRILAQRELLLVAAMVVIVVISTIAHPTSGRRRTSRSSWPIRWWS